MATNYKINKHLDLFNQAELVEESLDCGNYVRATKEKKNTWVSLVGFYPTQRSTAN